MKNKVSVVIPTYNRVGLLKQHLGLYNQQTVSTDRFEVIVVNDGGDPVDVNYEDYNYTLKVLEQDNSGPAKARNEGVKASSGDIILFVGDDCLPSNNLIFRHLYNHIRNGVTAAIQGYTPWHPSVFNQFLDFVNRHNLQVSWDNVKNDDGSWKYNVNPGYCVTTNYSIDRSLFEGMNGFDEDFKAAAWEDIEFGFRSMKIGFPHFFDSGATNYHYHQYDFHSFTERQRTEGFWRVLLCMKHYDFVDGLINPDFIRSFDGLMHESNPAIFSSLGTDPRTDKIVEEDMVKYMMAQSIAGIKRGFDHFDKRFNYLFFVQNVEIARKMVGAIDATLRGDTGFALHCCQWITEQEASILTHKFARDIKAGIFGEENREVVYHDLIISQIEDQQKNK